MSEVQTRSQRSSTARSIRPPPEAQLSHSTPGMRGPQPIEQGVEAERLGVHARRAGRERRWPPSASERLWSHFT